MEASGDHEVEDDEQIVVQAYDDALSESLDGADRLPHQLVEGRFDRPKKEWRLEPNLGDRLPDEPRLERLYIGDDIR